MTPPIPMNRPPTCTAHTTAGNPCRAPAVRGTNVCASHGGSAPQVRAAARRRLLAAVDPLMAELIRIALHDQSSAVRLAAIRDALDRAGLNAKLVIEATVNTETDIDRELRDLAAELDRRAATTAEHPGP